MKQEYTYRCPMKISRCGSAWLAAHAEGNYGGRLQESRQCSSIWDAYFSIMYNQYITFYYFRSSTELPAHKKVGYEQAGRLRATGRYTARETVAIGR